MMHRRHLTYDERQTLRAMADDAGVVEMIRCLAVIVGNDHPDCDAGGRLNMALLRIARELAKETDR